MCYLPKGCVLLFSVIHGGTDKLECANYNFISHNSFILDGGGCCVITPDY